MDAALARASEVPWNQVRMADLAQDVGVSRQTIHNEFGTKDSLVAALFESELERVLVGLDEVISEATTFECGLRDALLWVLDELAKLPVIRRMVADARDGSTDGLIPFLTYQSFAVMEPTRRRIVEAGMRRWPSIDSEVASVVAEFSVRFVLGQLVAPSDLAREQLVKGLVVMARHLDDLPGA